MDFIPESANEERNARVYRDIWTKDGERIVKALEARTCLPFAEPSVRVTVAEAVSHSGGPGGPMRLRASYFRNVKQATLVHELGHRHLWQLAERVDGVDGHRTLYLILDRVWADVWGEKFAEERIRHESSWHASYNYAAAWRWVRSLTPARRTELWNQLLVKNGFLGGCRGPGRK